jgi:two-component system chemotaxis sensor kinase CheA
MQPLDKLFGKYPRLIRYLARKLNKNIELVIEGGATEVDKSVIEELGDPLIHLMRNSADHGIEMPDKRKAAGKSETGTIKITAANVGGHVEICIIDDGKGLHRDFLAKKAIEKGLYTQAQLDAMTDREVYNIIFAAGFSTAEKLSDVSGRGVGMDVVRTNIEKLKGTIALESVPGQGCTVRIQIPLTVAIMSAMMVGAGKEIYAVPLSAIVEIVKPEGDQLTTIRGSSVMRLRDSVLPLVDASQIFNQPEHLRDQSPFAVVLQVSDKRFGLLVSRLIGQQEVVIKPLDETSGSKGPVSGATVRDDGGVSLIVDVNRLMHLAEARK